MALSAFESARGDNPVRVSKEAMDAIPEDSIDYAVMERSSRVKVVPSDIDGEI